jgi:hypothetical protein
MRFSLLSALIYVGFTSQVLMPAPARSEKDTTAPLPGFHLQQASTHIALTNVSLTGNKIRFDTPVNNMSTIIDGDTGKVIILNNKNKSYFLTDLSHWTPSVLSVSNVLQYFDYSVLVYGQATNETYKSFPVTHEKWKNLTSYDTPGRGKNERLTVVAADVISCQTLSKNATVLKATQKYFNIGPAKAYPLEFQSLCRKGSTAKSLTTKVLERKTFSAAICKVPTDYQPVKDQHAVYIDKTGTDTLEDMLR